MPAVSKLPPMYVRLIWPFWGTWHARSENHIIEFLLRILIFLAQFWWPGFLCPCCKCTCDPFDRCIGCTTRPSNTRPWSYPMMTAQDPSVLPLAPRRKFPSCERWAFNTTPHATSPLSGACIGTATGYTGFRASASFIKLLCCGFSSHAHCFCSHALHMTLGTCACP